MLTSNKHRLASLFARCGTAAMMYLYKAHALVLGSNLVGNALSIFLRGLALSPTTVVPSSSLVPKASLLGMGKEALFMEAAVFMLPPLHVPWGPPATPQISILCHPTYCFLRALCLPESCCLPVLRLTSILLSPCFPTPLLFDVGFIGCSFGGKSSQWYYLPLYCQE